jgi:hypothetical protein
MLGHTESDCRASAVSRRLILFNVFARERHHAAGDVTILIRAGLALLLRDEASIVLNQHGDEDGSVFAHTRRLECSANAAKVGAMMLSVICRSYPRNLLLNRLAGSGGKTSDTRRIPCLATACWGSARRRQEFDACPRLHASGDCWPCAERACNGGTRDREDWRTHDRG